MIAAEGAASAAFASGMGSGRREVTVGFGHEAVLSVAGEVVKAVQEERLKHIFLIGKSRQARKKVGAEDARDRSRGGSC